VKFFKAPIFLPLLLLSTVKAETLQQPGVATGAYAQGLSYLRNGQQALAREAFLEASKDPSTASGAHFQLAWLAVGASEWQDGEKWVRHFLSAQPRSPEGLYILGYVLFRQGRHEAAAVALRETLAKQPKNADAHKILGLAHFQMDQKLEAQKELQAAVRLNPGLTEAHYFLGRVNYTLNRFEEARQAFEKAIQLESQLMKAYDNLGLTLDAIGEGQGAIEAFRKAIELNEHLKINSKWPYLNLGELLLKQNQYSQSVPYFRKALAFDPNWAKAHSCLGKALLREGKSEEAKASFREAIRLDSASSDAHYQLGQLYRKEGDLEAAQRELKLFQQLKEKSSTPTLSAP
jgi:tetratricopeptide (TPR) repeat protein